MNNIHPKTMKKTIIQLIALMVCFSCSESNVSPGAGSDTTASDSQSKGGSTARFAVKEGILYVVDEARLSVFDISAENESTLLSNNQVGWGIETIFPYEDLLLLGTQTGVLIFDVSTPSQPVFISEYNHIMACDPVVTDGKFAYLTLRTGTDCGRPVNELQVLDLSDIANPKVINRVSMTNPKGLALNGNMLYVCDEGIKVLDVSDQQNIRTIKQVGNIAANDVIFHRNQLLVTADNGFFQFDADELTQLSQFAF
jgi:hypothetical protein